jgi:peptidoglycan/xylan/chitin deacetylase (PgdA/CDA1 family)
MKRLVKLFIGLAVAGMDLLLAVGAKLVGRQPRSRCVVLYYHAVPATQRSRFLAQMEILCKHATPIRAGHQAPLKPGRRYAAVTFDDAFLSVIENALPELEKRRIPATIFVPTGSLGQAPRWIKNGSAAAKHETVLSPEALKQLSGNPLLEFGSHTISHPHLPTLEPAQAQAELCDSKATLESLLSKSVTLFSFPHGEYNEALVRQAREYGYTRIFTIAPCLALQQPNEFVTGRVLADPSDWSLEFWLKLVGAYRWLALLRPTRPLNTSSAARVQGPEGAMAQTS